jgi:GDP-4-dehydro-6-deoxy-D-mannose reductase
MRILVTGVTGFAGSHLAEALLAQGGHRVIGVARQGTWPEACCHLAAQVELYACDLCAGEALEQILRAVQPERIYHLAGYPHAGRSFQEADAAWQGNLTATRSLYDAVVRWGGRPRILFVGSGLVYGDSATGVQGCSENDLLRPDNPYATSKAAADLASYQYTRYPGLDIVRVRPFNHIGPRQAPQFAVSNFARQLAAIESGRQPPVLQTGNLQSYRDLSDVRDVVAAYMLVMEQGRSGEVYNVGSGQSYAVQFVLERLIALSGVRVEVRQSANLLRAADAPHVRANADKLRRETGWAPRFRLEQTLADILAYWRGQEQANRPRPLSDK